MSMCAIAGIFALPKDANIQKKMLATMARRGPDGSGCYETADGCLLHSRLSIIDPVGGAQPMTAWQEGEKYTISYNGELYNTGELRQTLIKLGHSFEGRSDTEVLLHAYMQWKEGCLEHLNGIYAFAVLEEPSGRLFLARDRIGVKPLFYTQNAGGLIFASELKTILAHPDIPARIDAQGIGQLLLLGPGRTPGSGVFKDIWELEPGCCGFYEKGKLRTWRYWKLTDREHTEDFEATSEHVQALVLDAIRRQMVSDVPIGTFLSGGLDSSIISAVCAAAFREKGERLHTFSVDYQDNDKYFTASKFQPNSDGAYIELMQEHLGSAHHLTVLTPRQLTDAIVETTLARDLPGMADVDISLQLFCKQIRPHVKVALSGECADEIFGGYPWYRDPQIRNAEGFPWAQSTRQRAALLQGWVSDRLDPFAFVRQQYEDSLGQCDILPENSPLEKRMKQMMNLNFRWFMQTLLDRKDRMSMYHGLEVRVPFCDHRIAEYLYGVPWAFKDWQGREKGLLRHAMAGLLPDAVLYRKKSPYPKTHHPEYLRLAAQLLRQEVLEKGSGLLDIVRPQALENILSEDFEWPWYGQLMRRPQTIVYMLQIHFWLKAYSVEIV